MAKFKIHVLGLSAILFMLAACSSAPEAPVVATMSEEQVAQDLREVEAYLRYEAMKKAPRDPSVPADFMDYPYEEGPPPEYAEENEKRTEALERYREMRSQRVSPRTEEDRPKKKTRPKKVRVVKTPVPSVEESLEGPEEEEEPMPPEASKVSRPRPTPTVPMARVSPVSTAEANLDSSPAPTAHVFLEPTPVPSPTPIPEDNMTEYQESRIEIEQNLAFFCMQKRNTKRFGGQKACEEFAQGTHDKCMDKKSPWSKKVLKCVQKALKR